MKMYDIHMHIIPGVDDGSWSMDMSEQLLYMAYEQKIKKIIATPHSSAFLGGDKVVKENFRQLQELAGKILPDLKLYLGCEVRCCGLYMDKILKDLKSRRMPALNMTNYILTEFSTNIEPEEAAECARQLIADGWHPVLAHVERYRQLFSEKNCVEELQDMGCLFQINVYSVYDESSEKIKANARRLIDEKRVTFLGSDAHRTIHRPPSVRYGLEYLYANYEKDYIDRIAYKNAEELLNMRE